jgi:A/G-specific adenine glycosylase
MTAQTRTSATPNLAALQAWFAEHQRALPWRMGPHGARDPYRVWLSEVMLQQTRVATVIAYFERFVARFPTVADMAKAPIDDVLSLWSGLGYYSRGRSLHRAAQAVVAQGGFPTSSKGLEELPGIGPYTAAAVASLAFGERVAVLDGNVQRVLARLTNNANDLRHPSTKQHQQQLAQHLVDAHPHMPAGLINEALMELGATTCTPTSPRCSRCPLASECAALREGTVHMLPVLSKRAPRTNLRVVMLLMHHQGQVWLQRRPDDAGLFAGLFVGATREVASDGSEDESAIDALSVEHASSGRRVGPWHVERTLTHRNLHIAAYVVATDNIPKQAGTAFALSTLLHKHSPGRPALSSAMNAVLHACFAEPSLFAASDEV